MSSSKPSRGFIDITLTFIPKTTEKLTYLYSVEERIKEQTNPLRKDLLPSDKALLKYVQSYIKKYTAELDTEIEKGVQIDRTFDMFSKHAIYMRYYQLRRDEGLTVIEAHKTMLELMKNNDLNPSEYHINADPNSFNRKVNIYVQKQNRKE